ncbi:MAG: right-handed parallel beta-helix repeat-containing protein, partial [Deltaproteobacteria bacterium]|nr:right-handed parallel beta-helix repeat-containing protein [Deltaproteobacteria bacterium]MBW2534595.1 right-handed parallel beta-helix repeat-containing protein [Deltaproteobacteria bacterium]
MRKQGWLGLAVATMLGGLAGDASGADYYVDGEHGSASDAGPGTEQAPWLTIQHAADTVAPGDTVFVKAGTYAERVVLSTSGTAGSPIRFVAEPRRSAYMHGFNTSGADYVRIEGFDITNSPSFQEWDETQGVLIDSDYVEVIDNYFHEMTGTAIVGYWHDPFPQSATVADNEIHHMQMGITVQGTGWVVENNELSRLYMFGSGDCDYMRLFGDDHVIRNNRMHGTSIDEIGSAHVDCFQTFDNNGEHLRDVLVDGNTCSDFHQGFMGSAEFHQASSNITFMNNVFAHGWAWGLSVHQITNVTALYNTFVDIEHHGIGFRDNSTGNVVQGNIFFGTGTSYWASDGGEVTGDYNLVFDANDPSTVGAHDLIGQDPSFVDAANDDFRLSPGSPAIDAAADATEVDHDHDGTLRPQGAGWDIGAFEYCENGCATGGSGGAGGTATGGSGATGATGGSGTAGGAPSQSPSDDGGCGCRLDAR